MEMKNVKEIIIPNPTYELLEYVDIPAGCYLNFNDTGGSTLGYYLDCNWNVDEDEISGDSYPFGSIYTTTGSTYYRYHLIISSTNMRAASGNAQFAALFDTSASNQRYIVELNYRFNSKAYCDNVDKGTFAPTSGTNTGVVYIGARRFNNNGTITINDYPHTIRFYLAKSKSSSTNPDSIFYPVKRKSDNKVGILKVWKKGVAVRFCVTETDVEPIAGPKISDLIDISVKKITNSNGDIIWGNPTAFPYRRLEYIHFNGAEYIDTGLEGSSGKWWKVDVSYDSFGTTNDLLCSANTNLAAARQRFYIGRSNSSSKMQFALGNTWTSSVDVPLNTKLEIRCRTAQSSNNTSLSFNVDTPDETILTGTISSATGTTASNGLSLYLMANHLISGAERFSTGKIYDLIQRATNSTGTLEFVGVPCQRKSDGVCGIYDTVNSVFKPMVGTTITDSAAGPVLDEYWDLTAPA